MKNKNIKDVAMDWWNSLPIQNLVDMDDSWVGYVHKYLPNRGGIYALSDAEILYIWKKEHSTSFVEIMIKKIFC
jgi:hypothetical protein